jgi:hypothetical protein
VDGNTSTTNVTSSVTQPDGLPPADIPELDKQTCWVPGAWLRDVVKGKEEMMFRFSWGGGQPPTIELSEEMTKALLIMVKMREIVRN